MGCLCSQTVKKQDYAKTQANFKDLYRTYNIDKNRMGKGSFGTVYKGTNKEDSSTQLAIKAIDKTKLSQKEVAEIHEEVKLI